MSFFLFLFFGKIYKCLLVKNHFAHHSFGNSSTSFGFLTIQPSIKYQLIILAFIFLLFFRIRIFISNLREDESRVFSFLISQQKLRKRLKFDFNRLKLIQTNLGNCLLNFTHSGNHKGIFCISPIVIPSHELNSNRLAGQQILYILPKSRSKKIRCIRGRKPIPISNNRWCNIPNSLCTTIQMSKGP